MSTSMFVLRDHFPTKDIFIASDPLELIQKLTEHYDRMTEDAERDHFWGGGVYVYVDGQEYNPANVVTALYYFGQDHDPAISETLGDWYRPSSFETINRGFYVWQDFDIERMVYRDLCRILNMPCDLPEETEED